VSEVCRSECAVAAVRSESGSSTALRAADWLCLAATPAFAIAALLIGVFGGGQPDILCSAAEHTLPMGGMTLMYLLMSAFYSPPWLHLIRRSGDRRA
jgi:hypothetical protein